MATFEARKVLMKDAQGRYVIPFTGAVETVNGQKPDENGNVVIEGVDTTTLLTKTVAAETYLSKTDAASTYLRVDTAADTFLNKTDASSTYLTQAQASAAYLGIGDKAVSAETADNAVSATMASKAISDANGNAIATTYATKAELTEKVNGRLPLSGGTMLGSIVFKTPNVISRNSDDTCLAILSGTDATSSYLQLFGKNYSASPGGFLLKAQSSNGNLSLIGLPDGTLRWGSSNIVRTVNGVGADASGNIQVGTGDAYEADILEAADKALETVSNVGNTDIANVLSAVASVEARIDSHIRVVETWKSSDGLSWYRKWSDGWIEQGGYETSYDSKGTYTCSKTIVFNTPFSDTKYGFHATTRGESQMTYEDKNTARSTTGLKVSNNIKSGISSNMTQGISWYACGY